MREKYVKAMRAARAAGIAALVCAILLTLLIFGEALTPAERSGAQSDAVADAVRKAARITAADEPAPGRTPSGRPARRISMSGEEFGRAIREGFGHFGLFAVLGIFVSVALSIFLKPSFLAPFAAVLYAAATAAVSEILQLPVFTSGRVPDVKDFALDVCGAAAGTLLVVLVLSAAAIDWKRRRPERFGAFRSAISDVSLRKASGKDGGARGEAGASNA